MDSASRRRSGRQLSLFALCASVAVVTVLSWIPAAYAAPFYFALAAVQLAVICGAAWALGARAIAAGPDAPRKLATGGALLVAPFALFSLLAGAGPPEFATPLENQLRYLVLFAGTILVGAGLFILSRALSDAGERVYSALAFTAVLIATPLYFLWAAILLFAYLTGISSTALPAWATRLADLSDAFLFVGCALTYLATAAFARALRRVKWLGRIATAAFVGASLLATLFLALRGLSFPDAALALGDWRRIPGYIAGIPAVPWIMPSLFGVLLLWRAGMAEVESRAEVP
jgi:hypothetical protein